LNSVKPTLIPSEVRELFVNHDPVESWTKAKLIVQSMSPDTDLTNVKNVFDEVMCLFTGAYPGYIPIQTPYHDLRHTLDVFMCSVRLMHGIHLSETPLNAEEIQMIMVAALLHDVGYAQKVAEASGSGAQFTQIHVSRGIDFMALNLGSWLIPANWETPLRQIIRCTDLRVNLADINFSTPRIRLLGQIVGSADIVGQMADRNYLEKLLFLYSEFKEANYGNCENTHDLLKKSQAFYITIRKTLEGELGGKYRRLNFHFNNWIGEDKNFYVESIENNIRYLEKVIALNETEWFSMLKRHGVVQRYQEINKSTPAITPTIS
jgi:hypothetical protein